MAILISAAAAFCFVLIAAAYKGNVDSYRLEYGSDFESESFIRILFKSNFVLYPELLEKSGKAYDMGDLYLSFEEETGNEVIYYGNETASGRTSERFRTDCRLGVQQSLQRVDELYTKELGRRMDYCVIDRETQTVLKNTTRNPERLADITEVMTGVTVELAEGHTTGYTEYQIQSMADGTVAEDMEYAYYIIICYDKNGCVSEINVHGNDTERFFKNAQIVATSAESVVFGESRKVTYCTVVDDTGDVAGRMTVTEKNPRDVIFIYAMTEGQIDGFSWLPLYENTEYDEIWLSDYIGTFAKEDLYEKLGIGRIYLVFLAVITVIVFILTRYVPQLTADTAGTKCHAELIFLIQFILAVASYEWVIHIVYCINEISADFRAVPYFSYAARYCFLSGVMFLLFFAWYWCLMSIRGIFLGFGAFISERGFLHRIRTRIREFFAKLRNQWQAELAKADLGKNNTRLVRRMVLLQFAVLAVISYFWAYGVFFIAAYSLLLYTLLKRYLVKIQKQYQNLMQATNAIAQGKFDNDFKSDFGIFESYKNELYQIQDGFARAVEDEVKSQRMKTELITNVSHDLKTPLTAIITYIDLLKDENITEEQRKSYLDTLERKSLRLKVLIEDLFEISKASSGNVKLELVSVDICSLMRQVYLEHEDKMNENGLEMRFFLPEEKVVLQLDSQKTYRIFENLYVNITKYAMKNTRVYVLAEKIDDGGIHIEMKNISEQELTINPMDLTERFVRGDASRNTEGSGLGLAIARSFTQLQGGTFVIQVDGDLFKVVIEWKK